MARPGPPFSHRTRNTPENPQDDQRPASRQAPEPESGPGHRQEPEPPDQGAQHSCDVHRGGEGDDDSEHGPRGDRGPDATGPGAVRPHRPDHQPGRREGRATAPARVEIRPPPIAASAGGEHRPAEGRNRDPVAAHEARSRTGVAAQEGQRHRETERQAKQHVH